MALGNKIIVTANPKGNFDEGIVSGTPKPGTVMQISAGVAAVGGKYQWEVYNSDADGNQRIIAVLLPDSLQGKLATAAYVSGDRCFLYFPLPGDQLNMLWSDVAGTGTGSDIAIGDLLIVDDGTGKLVHSAGSPESEPFVALEAQTDLTADTLTHVMFTGY